MTMLMSKVFNKNLTTVPYICLRGAVSRQMTIYLTSMLTKVPSKTKKLAIIVNSNQGSFAQAHIINAKINQFAKLKNLEVLTFIQEFATNAGFMIGTNGSKIYADKTSVLGGLQVSIQKLKLGEMIKHVTYSTQPSVGSQLNNNNEINTQKRKEMERIYQQFSQDAQKQIRTARKIKKEIDFRTFFTAEQAKQAGVIDQLGRMFEVMQKQVPNSSLQKITQSYYQQIRSELRKLNFW